ncbi:MAG: bifunctional [glutamate--ammonia ligase]-adenylyl-L-tyrosine phosphorylase/[glutamate--ammonia-ligase] adenylyltransferase [Gammaproteobacteria bacterium]
MTRKTSETFPEVLDQEFNNLLSGLDSDLGELIKNPKAKKVLSCSQFVANYCQCNPQEFKQLLINSDLKTKRTRKDYAKLYKKKLKGIEEDDDLMRVMRQFRNYEMVRIAWRDIAGLSDLEETTSELSLLAEEMLDKTLSLLHHWLAERFGQPENAAGEPQQMVIVAMGKLGAHELNFSSDIDLIFAFPEAGETNNQKINQKKSLDNQEFFIRLGKQLIKVFNEMTEDGFVFRMDMRLRPFGESGALALNFDAMEEYYVSHARDWERYAMIKANIAAGDKVAGAGLMKMLQPFVFRRYLDYGAYDAIRKMKEMIDREVLRKGMTSDVKLGRGGIREVEFIGQTFQLLRGGREPELQARKILKILTVLKNLEILNKKEQKELREAYVFLRNTEHRIQEIADQQTQALPTSELDRARVSYGMGFDNWEDFLSDLDKYRDRVSFRFSSLLKTDDDEENEKVPVDLTAIWMNEIDQEDVEVELAKLGFDQPLEILQMIDLTREAYGQAQLSNDARERLDRLMPCVLDGISNVSNNDQIVAMQRVLNLIDSVVKRSVYLSLLKEHPEALNRLIKLCAVSPWIADYISRQPILLDELIDRESLYSPPEQKELVAFLDEQLFNLHLGDLERQMDILRHFRHSQVLRIAAADITGNSPLAEVSNYLSCIAEIVLSAAADLAWVEMVERYGEPCYSKEGEKSVANFTIIAYGKLGGHELGYGSDLDVVFVHDSHGEDQFTNGEKQVDNTVFFNRLGQRLILILTAVTQAGRTYEIDTRLRPSGMSGFLVTSMESFAEYQQEKAWTWEHQALVRARAISGDQVIQDAFDKVRSLILSRKRNQKDLKKDVREMREKMRESLVKKAKGMFDIKQGVGGMADIEFIVQYSVLYWSADHKELEAYTDNLRLLEILSELKLLKTEEAELLRDAYFSYRADGHQLALQEKQALVPETEYKEYREGVSKIWNKLINED